MKLKMPRLVLPTQDRAAKQSNQYERPIHLHYSRFRQKGKDMAGIEDEKEKIIELVREVDNKTYLSYIYKLLKEFLRKIA